MIINVGDKIIGNHGRTGEIINIGIATEMTDIALKMIQPFKCKNI